MTGRPPPPEALPRPVTDAHTHLDTTTDRSGLTAAEAVRLARGVGVTRLVDVGCDVDGSADAVAHAEEFAEVVAAVALHPNDAARLGGRLRGELARLEALIPTSERIRGVGETGLDYFRTTDADARALQKESFAAHIAWARRYDKALVIHDRDAHDDILDVLDAEGWPDRVQFHCFSGDGELARRCLDRGAWLSFPGTVTFKANEALREALRLTPADRLLVETDAPFLTPMPYRGRPNASYLVPVTVRFVARVRGDDLAALCDALHGNATALFRDWGGDG